MDTRPTPDEPLLPPAPKTLLGIACLLALSIAVAIAMVPALVALAPLAVAVVPVAFLVWRSHRRRQVSQGRNMDEMNVHELEANDWYRRERQKRGRIIDDRVDHLL